MPGAMAAIMGLDAATREATSSGYQMALKWCLRCDVGWAGMEGDECWLCGKDDETHRWGPSAGAFRFYPTKARTA